MERERHTQTTVTVDKRRFKTTAPDGTVCYLTLTVETREETVTRPVRAPLDPGALHDRTTTKTQTTRRRQVHRATPYPGARPVRISSHADTTSAVRESVARREDPEVPGQEYA